ncbi:MAG: lysostaphin resistance A-like protein [Bacillaceae bacterium]
MEIQTHIEKPAKKVTWVSIILFVFAYVAISYSFGFLLRTSNLLFINKYNITILGGIIFAITMLFFKSIRVYCAESFNVKAIWSIKNWVMIIVTFIILFLICANIFNNPLRSTWDLLTSPYSRNPSATIFQQFQYVISTAIFAPLWEEAFFRGVLFRKLNENMHVIFSILISATIFAISHMQPIEDSILFFSFGILTAIVYKLSHSWFVTVVIHAIWNLFVTYYLNFF